MNFVSVECTLVEMINGSYLLSTSWVNLGQFCVRILVILSVGLLDLVNIELVPMGSDGLVYVNFDEVDFLF